MGDNHMNLHIREALQSDLPGILGCAKAFFEYAGYAAQGMPLDDGSFNSMVAEYIKNPRGIVVLLMDELFVAGGIAGMVFPWGFNREILLCQELFFWVNHEYRGRNSLKLFNEYERLCMARGARHNLMLSVPTELEDGVARLYQKRGYRVLETMFIRRMAE